MSIVSNILYAITDIHCCFSSNIISCCAACFAQPQIEMFLIQCYKGPSINDVTIFWAKIYPLPPCHISSQVFNPLFKYNVTICNPPPYISNYKFPSILCLPRQKFHLFYRFDLCTLWQDQHSIRKTSKILHTLLSNSGVQRGGERGAGPGHPRPGGHPKSGITKIEML